MIQTATATADNGADVLEPQTIIAIGDGADAWIPRSTRRPEIDRLDVDALQSAQDAPAVLSTFRDQIVRFKIRLANTEGVRSSASYLIQKMYGWRGYSVSPLPNDQRPITIVASDADRALATISVRFDSAEKLLADELYGAELGNLRAKGARLCEFTRLAIDRGEQSREVLAMMFHVAYIYARRFARCTDLLIEVNPRHVRFYQAMLGFETVAGERICPRVNAPAVLLRLDLSYCEQQIARYGGHRELAGSTRSLYPLAFSLREEDGIRGRLRQLG